MTKYVNQEEKFRADQNEPFWMLASLNVDKVEAIAECVRANIAGHFGIDENEGFWNLAAIEIEISDLIAEQKANVGNNTPKKLSEKTITSISKMSARRSQKAREAEGEGAGKNISWQI